MLSWREHDARAVLRALNRDHRTRHGGEPLEEGARVSLEGIEGRAGLYPFPSSFRRAVADLEESGALEGAGGGKEAYVVTARALEMLAEGDDSAN